LVLHRFCTDLKESYVSVALLLLLSLSLTSRRIYSIFCIAYLPSSLDSVPVEEATRPRTVYAPVTLDSFRPPHLRITSISPLHRPTIAAPREFSPVREDTVVDANNSWVCTLIEHYERTRSIVFCKFFCLERFGSFRCASMLSASMFPASPPADPSTLMRTVKHFWTRTCTAYFAAT
jgi:hypothetical protein